MFSLVVRGFYGLFRIDVFVFIGLIVFFFLGIVGSLLVCWLRCFLLLDLSSLLRLDREDFTFRILLHVLCEDMIEKDNVL